MIAADAHSNRQDNIQEQQHCEITYAEPKQQAFEI